MDIAMCNDCGKCYCWVWDTADVPLQCPNCRSERIITDKCTIASVMNVLTKVTDNFMKSLESKEKPDVMYVINSCINNSNNNNL